MSHRLLAAGAVALLAGGSAAGCSSTQQKSAELAREAADVVAERGLELGRPSADVRVTATALVGDRYGTAAAVRVRAGGRRPQVAVPLAVKITGRGRKELFANTGPGLATSLNHVPVLRPGETIWWVNDQIDADVAGGARRVTAEVGTPAKRPPARLPRLEVGDLSLGSDPDGLYTRGRVRNRSQVDQLQLILFAVARRGGRVVAAGRAGVDKLKAGKAATFKVFWIGNPRRARVEVAAPPSTLR